MLCGELGVEVWRRGARVAFAREEARRGRGGSGAARLVAATTTATHARGRGEAVSERRAVDDLSTGAVRELREKRSEEMTGRAQVQVTQKKTSFLTKGTQC